VNDTFTAMRRDDVPILTEVGDYAGQEALKVSCTQLGTNHTAAQARRVVADWMDFFSCGPKRDTRPGVRHADPQTALRVPAGTDPAPAAGHQVG